MSGVERRRRAAPFSGRVREIRFCELGVAGRGVYVFMALAVKVDEPAFMTTPETGDYFAIVMCG